MGAGFTAEGKTAVNDSAVVLNLGEPTEAVITAGNWKGAMNRIQAQDIQIQAQGAQIEAQDVRIGAQEQEIVSLQSQTQFLQAQVASLNATIFKIERQLGATCSASDVLNLIDCYAVKEVCGLYFEQGTYTIRFAGAGELIPVYCDADGRSLMASTVTHMASIHADDPRSATLGVASPDEDYIMQMDYWAALFGDGALYDFHADITATNKVPFRFKFYSWGIRASDYAYKHAGGGCYQPFDSTTSTCSRPQWVHNDNSDGTWQGTFGAPCCSGDYGWGGSCGFGQFHGDNSGAFVYSFDTDGQYRNPITTTVSRLSFWAARR